MIHLRRLYAHNFKQLQEFELCFPEHARILVQGKNEAGKSTLFEAVFFALFGNALATEGSTRGLDGLIGYGQEKARVELQVQCGERVFKITRSIVRNKSNVWELDITRDGQVAEEIRGNLAVNKRLVGELGFDGDALLNTRFVEQKKLEKLEGLTRAKREESLAKILNLDALVALESDLKIRAEDKQELERLKTRAELADIQAQLPAREKELAEVESKLNLIELRRMVTGAAEEMRAVETLDEKIRSLTDQRDQANQRVTAANNIKDAMMSIKDALDASERVQQNERDAQRLRADHVESKRATQDLPNLQTRMTDLARLSCVTRRLDQVRTAREKYADRASVLAGVQDRFTQLNATVTREEQVLAQMETQVHEFEIGEVLGDWIATKRDAPDATPAHDSIREKEQARNRISKRFFLQVGGLGAVVLVLLAIGFASLLFFIAATTFPVLPLALVSFALAGFVLVALVLRASRLWNELERAAEALGQAQGEARALTTSSDARAVRLKQAEARLAQLGAAVPETIDLAHSQRMGIAREMKNRTGEELHAGLAATRERLLNARAVLGELQRQHAIEDSVNVQAEHARCESATKKADKILSAWQPRANALANSLNIELRADVIQRARFQLEAQIEQMTRRATDAARLEKEITRREEGTRALLERARESYEKARTIMPEGLKVPDWNPSLTAEDYTAFGKELRKEYDALGGEKVVTEMRQIEGQLGRKQGERETRAKNAEMLIANAQDLLGHNSSQTISGLRGLEELATRLSDMDLGDEDELRVKHRESVGRVHSLRDRQTQLEHELGLQGELLDSSQCKAEHAEKARALQVRERGVEIVSLARRRVMQKVLPVTMDYMQQILPMLTRERYTLAELDEENFKIRVWDERAENGGAFKEKNIFSGGTRDQFSLALRLAFALATMPQERGTAPSFIFLDEPLGSFDDERAESLIHLLTQGEITRAFDQIFLISHVHVDPRAFTHHLVLERGRIVSSDLPQHGD